METADIKEILMHGLDSVSSTQKVEISLRDFVLLFKTVEELRRFFHNPEHLNDVITVEQYVGNKENGIYSLLNEIYQDKLGKLVTPEVEALLESDALDHGKYPVYFK